MPRLAFHDALNTLTKHLGRESAALELRWLKEAARDASHLHAMISRRVRGEPLQYILGTQPFGPLSLLTRQPVLIPRPETEDWALRLADSIHPAPQRPIRMLDLCTGSGCIPLLLCHLWPPGSVCAVGADISEDAIQLASENARQCKVPEPASEPSSASRQTVESENTFLPVLANIRDPSFVLSSALRCPFHLITSNPPYITNEDYQHLSPSVKNYEDPRALLGDPKPNAADKGLTFYRDIAKLVSRDGFLDEDGTVAVEVGAGQARDVEEIFQEEGGLRRTEIWNDPWNVQRVVIGRP